MSDLFPRRCYLLFGSMLICLLGASKNTYGQSSQKLQALYIYSFAKYVSWEKDTSKFIIGVLGESEIIPELEKGAVQRKIGGKPIEIKKFNELADIYQCHMVYLPKAYSKVLPHLLTITEGKPVLIISEDDLAKKGAGISFFIEDNLLRFKINTKVLRDLGLIVNKGLLDLAVII